MSHHHLIVLAKIAIVAAAAITASRTDHNPRVFVPLHQPAHHAEPYPIGPIVHVGR